MEPSRYHSGCCDIHDYLLEFLTLGLRTDGRRQDQIRSLALNVGSITNADGSALVRYGDTVVICGIKLQLIASREANSLLVCNMDCASGCLPESTAGAPSLQQQAIAEELQIVLNHCIELEQLVVNSEYSCVVNVDLVCLSHHGNVFDACIFAAMAGLQNTRFPTFLMEPAGKMLPELKPIFAVSFALFDGHYLLDPSLEEEKNSQGYLIICVDSEKQLRHLQHKGSKITEQELLSLTKLAVKQVTVFNELLQTSRQTL